MWLQALVARRYFSPFIRAEIFVQAIGGEVLGSGKAIQFVPTIAIDKRKIENPNKFFH